MRLPRGDIVEQRIAQYAGHLAGEREARLRTTIVKGLLICRSASAATHTLSAVPMSTEFTFGRKTPEMSTIGDENPYSPPTSSDRLVRSRRTHVGPILSGVLAIVLATILTRGGALIPAILGVGSWWLYKFWPMKKAPEDVGVRTFLERIEHSPTIENDAPNAADRDSPEQPLDALRDLRM
jgi:hypothetical protein